MKIIIKTKQSEVQRTNMNRQNLHENLFQTIANTIALFQLKRQLPKAMIEAGDDPDLQQTLTALKFHTEELERRLKNHCKRHPESKQCKDKSGNK